MIQEADTDDIKEALSSNAIAGKINRTMLSIQENHLRTLLISSSQIDSMQNKIIDINSLLSALDNLITDAYESSAEVPISFYLKQITISQIASTWINKYYPNTIIDNNDEAG